jgi:hypothetical protein
MMFTKERTDMRDYFAELDDELIRRGPEFTNIHGVMFPANYGPPLPPLYVAPYPELTREARTAINQTNICRALQERPDIDQAERDRIIKRLRSVQNA